MQVALEYASVLGLAVLPCGRDCKPGRLRKLQPPEEGESEWIAVYDATRDPDVIREYWAAYPDANVSVATGDLSGAFVLDIDTKEGFDGAADLDRLQGMFGELPRTWRSRTPSGGAHLWFRQPDRPIANRVHFMIPDGRGGQVKSGLDVRTTGGAAAAPPSRKPTGAYVWEDDPGDVALADAPGWLLELIDPPLPPQKPYEPVHLGSLMRMTRYVEAAVNGECGELARMGPGSGRNQKLFLAAAKLGQLVGADLLHESVAERALLRAAGDCGLLKEDGQRACAATIASGMKKGLAQPREVAR